MVRLALAFRVMKPQPASRNAFNDCSLDMPRIESPTSAIGPLTATRANAGEDACGTELLPLASPDGSFTDDGNDDDDWTVTPDGATARVGPGRATDDGADVVTGVVADETAPQAGSSSGRARAASTLTAAGSHRLTGPG